MWPVNSKARYGILLLLALLAFFGAVGPDSALAQSRGCQFIGASKATAEDITILSNVLLNTGGNLQVSMLPFEFNPGNPFGNATDLSQMVTPGLNGSLRITFYLKWFPHDGPGPADQNDFWAAWAANRPTARQQNIRNDFMGRVQQTDAWIASIRLWAAQNGIEGKLGITVVPVLEDTCSSRDTYIKILNTIRQQQVNDGTPTPLRRSCLPQHVFRLGVPLELHGPWAEVRGRLAAGDTWSNDGSDYSVDDFIRDQREALGGGVHVLYWVQSYNGHPRTRYNWAQRTIDPYTGSGGRTERRALRDVLGSR